MAERDEGRRGDLEFGSIPRLIQRSAERFGRLPAIIDGDTTLTFEGLAVEVARVARALVAMGLLRGDRVSIWAPNSAAWATVALGIQAAGGVLVPINTRLKIGEATEILQKSGARALFVSPVHVSMSHVVALRQSGAALPDLRSIVLLDGDAPQGILSFDAFVALSHDVSGAEADARALSVEPSDLSDILFTSGTTGFPKGVRCTHAQTLRAFRDWADTTGLREGDRMLVVLPFSHSFGYKAGLLASLMMGAAVLPEALFDAGALLARIARERVTVLPGPPSLYQTILGRPELAEHDLSSLRLAVTGAAVIPVELIHRMRSELAFKTIITGYGLSESSGMATMCREGDDPETIANTSGRAIPGVEVRVTDDDGREVPRGTPGEVRVRGYNVMDGYHEDPAETAATIDAEGWLFTGDIGIMDEQGYLRITDRKKDVFIVGGFNAYPAEIERIILTHEAAAQAAVVGAPDARLGEVGVAFVVLRPGKELTPEELIAFCRERMANYKVPRRVEIVGELPMNATGKVLRFRLRERVRAELSRASG